MLNRDGVLEIKNEAFLKILCCRSCYYWAVYTLHECFITCFHKKKKLFTALLDQNIGNKFVKLCLNVKAGSQNIRPTA